VLLQEGAEVAQLYRVAATPTGYLIDERGRTASPLAIGAQRLLALAGAPSAAGPAATTEQSNQVQRLGGSLAASRINRSGLKAGTPAPAFRLPRVGGGELSPSDFLGRPLLLVFSDPLCGPCQDLAPKLEELHRRSGALQVAMVSRREEDLNRDKIAELGLTFPVALQRHWEVSRAYGTFATPAGYRIDERGVIAAELAMGTDAILALAASPVSDG
jgi:peroxiredoxin